jgi:hypothetical protein
LFSWDADTEIFTEGFRDKIFDAEIVATLGRALSLDEESEDYYIKRSVVDFFSVAADQGAFYCFYGMLIPKYSQRDFGTRYLMLRSSPHLDVH